MTRRISLRQVEGFLHASEHLSFSRAAVEMHITQSAFSQLIQTLEHQLGVRLFERTTRSVTLTPAGEAMQRKLRVGLEAIDAACDEAIAIGFGDSGNLRLGAISTLAIGVVIRSLEQLREGVPGISVSMQEGYSQALAEGVAAGHIDLAVCCEVKPLARLSFEYVFDDELVLVTRAASPLAGRSAVRWTDLAGESLVLTARGTNSCEQVLAALASHGVPDPNRYEAATVPTTLTMVRAGFGSGFVSRIVLCDADMTGLAAIRIDEPATRRMGIYRRGDRLASNASLRFAELLRQEVEATSTRAGLDPRSGIVKSGD